MENKRDALRVDTVGVSCSTLEEVFLNVAELHDATDDAGEGSGRESRVASPALAPAPSATSSPSSALAPPPRAVENPESSSSVASTPPLVHGLALTCAQYRAVLVKRLTHARRDKLSHVTMYLVPLLFVVLGLVVSKISADAARDPPPAVMNDASFVGDLPLAFATAAGASVAKRILASASNARTLRAFEENEIAEIETVNATWHCWNASAVLDSCEPAVEACDQCTPLDDAGATLDGFLLENSVSARSSCVGGAHAFPTCAGLFAGAATGTLRLSESSRVFNYTIAVSSTAFHALPSTMASAHDAFFAALHATNASGVAAASMTTINHPLPTTPEKKAEQAMLMQLIVSLCVIMGLACLSASVAVFLVWERASASKHLQTVSGLHRGVFWAGTYTWDLLACFPPILLIFLAFAASGLDAYDGDALAVIAVALVLFITSAIPLAYIFHWPFENNMAALAAQMGTYFFFGVAQLIAGVVLAGLAAAGVATRDARLGRVGSYLSVAAALLRRPRAVHAVRREHRPRVRARRRREVAVERRRRRRGAESDGVRDGRLRRARRRDRIRRVQRERVEGRGRTRARTVARRAGRGAARAIRRRRRRRPGRRRGRQGRSDASRSRRTRRGRIRSRRDGSRSGTQSAAAGTCAR